MPCERPFLGNNLRQIGELWTHLSASGSKRKRQNVFTHRSIGNNARLFLLQRDFPKGKIRTNREDYRDFTQETYQCGHRHNEGYGKDTDQTHGRNDRIAFSDERTFKKTFDLGKESGRRKT